MYRDYAIMREPGRAAEARSRNPRPKRMAVVNASGELEALGDFVHDRYLATGNRQYAGCRYEWRSNRSWSAPWKPWNGKDDPGTRGREWSVVVTLRNGASEHDVRFLAWR